MELPMASKRFKAFVVTGLATAVLAGIPAISSAKNYTGKTSAVATGMMTEMPVVSSVTTPVVSTVNKHKKLTAVTKKAKKLTTSAKKKLKKHKKLAKKVKA
jgi:hypothetical protein